jgi:DNA-binding response OmpR family regulator
MGLQVLLVQPALDEHVPLLMAGLTERHCDVSVLTTFHEAREHLMKSPPDVLVTDLKLHAYNGLHLVLIARRRSDRTFAVVLADSADAIVRADAAAIGARLELKPLGPEEVDALVEEALRRCEPSGVHFTRRRT